VQLLVLIVAMLAVSRISMLFVNDKLLLSFRQWVIKKWGQESLAAYLIFCNWCMSIWFAIPIMPIAVLYPNKWVLAVLAIPAASLVAGLVSKVRE
jgi:hypothetical protein